MAFDIMYLNGRDLRSLPLEQRKELLASVVTDPPGGKIRLVEHIVGHGPAVFAEACKHELEGIVSKRRGSPYISTRSRWWLKLKRPGWKSHWKPG